MKIIHTTDQKVEKENKPATEASILTPLMKTSYHPAITVAFYLNCLPAEILQCIPRSTRFDWQHREKAAYFGYDWFCQNQQLFETLRQVASNKKLIKVNRALIRIIAIKRFLAKYAACVKDQLYSVPETIVFNIAKVSSIFGLAKTLRFLQLPYTAYLKLKKIARCSQSAFDLCRVKHPAQLLKKEITIIKQYCSEGRFIHWPLSSVYEMIKRESAAFFSISTFYKYVNLLHLKRSGLVHRRKNHAIGIRAIKPLQIIHADVTVFRTADNCKNYIYLVLDNFSRAILHFVVKTTCIAQITFESLQSVYETYLHPAGLENCQLISDDGSENYGPVKDFVASSHHPSIQHLIAQRDIEFSNSMIEAANKQLKYRFLYHQHIADYNALVEFVAAAVQEYNNRPHHVLHGLTPLEVLGGQIPDKHAYTSKIQQAKTARVIENKKTRCCNYSF